MCDGRLQSNITIARSKSCFINTMEIYSWPIPTAPENCKVKISFRVFRVQNLASSVLRKDNPIHANSKQVKVKLCRVNI